MAVYENIQPHEWEDSMDILEKLQEEKILARNQRETAYKENDVVFGLYWLGVGAGILKAMDLIKETKKK